MRAYKLGTLRVPISFIVLLACCNKQGEQRNCDYLTKEASDNFECYLHEKKESCLLKASQFVRAALLCDSLRPLNHWLNIKVFSAQNRFDSVLYGIERFERISSGPDLMFVKGEVYRKLGNQDSANLYYEKSLDGFDHLLKTDSLNSSLILGKLQTIVYLNGRKEMLRQLEFYQSNYGHLPGFNFLENVPMLLDSIP